MDCVRSDIRSQAPPTRRGTLQVAPSRAWSATRAMPGANSLHAPPRASRLPLVDGLPCNRRVPAAIQLGRIRPTEPHFARAASSFVEARELIQRVEEAKRVVELHRKTRPRGPLLDFTQLVVSALDAVHS